jgi:hypothetical protein
MRSRLTTEICLSMFLGFGMAYFISILFTWQGKQTFTAFFQGLEMFFLWLYLTFTC